MSPSLLPLYQAQQVQQIDRAVITAGRSGYSLMCQAGAAAFTVIQRQWPEARALTLICGLGNNAGDGYVVAHLAATVGFSVTVIQLGDTAKLHGEAAEAYHEMLTTGITPIPYTPETRIDGDLIIDALLGIGLERNLEGLWHDAVTQINQSGTPIFSIDLPSGLNADRGVAMGIAVEADHTLTMIAYKQGCFTADGPDHCGKLELAPLDINPLDHHPPSGWLLQTIPPLEKRRRAFHKGDAGHLLLIGGGPGMAGAIRIAAEAAARSGAGLISVATHPDHAPLLNQNRPELMVHGVSGTKALAPLLQRATVVAIGPGLGQSRWARELLEAAQSSGLPLVVDADALNLIAQHPIRSEERILTPHPGEAARLLDTTTEAVQQNRFKAVQQLQQHYGGVVVLKGNGTLISDGEKPFTLCPFGNPGMASGGMGDLLTGIVGALLAQGLSPLDAAKTGVWIHARAGDLAAAEGERGMLASDLMEPIRQLLNR